MLPPRLYFWWVAFFTCTCLGLSPREPPTPASPRRWPIAPCVRHHQPQIAFTNCSLALRPRRRIGAGATSASSGYFCHRSTNRPAPAPHGASAAAPAPPAPAIAPSRHPPAAASCARLSTIESVTHRSGAHGGGPQALQSSDSLASSAIRCQSGVGRSSAQRSSAPAQPPALRRQGARRNRRPARRRSSPPAGPGN